MRLTSIRRRRRRRWRQRPEIFRRRWSVATPVGLHPSYVATDHRRFLTTNPGGTPLIIRGKLFRQPRPALSSLDQSIGRDPVGGGRRCASRVARTGAPSFGRMNSPAASNQIKPHLAPQHLGRPLQRRERYIAVLGVEQAADLASARARALGEPAAGELLSLNGLLDLEGEDF